ncbi:unnamed protein product [Trifolium pratense]|uniref:Uncharacterized protein n=1 Tax=Trifolium pratense TaxID=57577 RepID=A0ACB0LRC7_TRIPR|nr:unnamed protein product [Trifolium pratense]
MAENSSAEHVDKVTLRVLVDKEKNKVVYAEAGKDFVDVLFSFLTLPLGTIARLVAKESNIEAVRFGSISSLYQSVSDLDEQYLWSKTCKDMLLMPRNSMGSYCKNMKLNIDDTEPLQSYYLCEEETCKIENRPCVSCFSNQKCTICGGLLNQKNTLILTEQIGFVKQTSAFIVSDDLVVMPNIIGTSLNLLQKHGINGFDTIDKQTVNISKKEVIDLLKLSLVSKTALSDFILKKEQFVYKLDPRNRFGVFTVEEKELSDKMVVKVVRRKSNEQILFVEAEEDFVDFIFSFLTFPLGGVLRVLQGLSFLYCIDNLYNSMTELSPDKCFSSQKLKDLLTNPNVSTQLELRNQILPIRNNNYKERNTSFNYVDPKSSISGGYTNGPITFMVTDELVVTPMSSIDGISYLERMKVLLDDVEEMVINIGQKEGLSILKASLSSTSALTNGLNQYLGSTLKKPKEESEG